MYKTIGLHTFILLLFLILVSCGTGSDEKTKQAETLKKGKNLYNKYGCGVCHSLEGKEIYGPPLNQIYGKEIKIVRQQKEFTVVADRGYLIKAITDPRFEKVSGYQNKDMPVPVFPKEEAEILADYIILINQKDPEK